MPLPDERVSERHTADWLASARELLTAADVSRTIARIAHQIIEKTALDGDDPATPRVVLIGIPTRGTSLSVRLADKIEEFAGTRPAHRPPRQKRSGHLSEPDLVGTSPRQAAPVSQPDPEVSPRFCH